MQTCSRCPGARAPVGHLWARSSPRSKARVLLFDIGFFFLGVHSRANLPEGGDTRRRVVGRRDFRLAHTKFAREDRLMSPSQNRSWQVLIGALPVVARPSRVHRASSSWRRLQQVFGAIPLAPAPPSTWRSIQEAIGVVPRISRPSVEPAAQPAEVPQTRP